MAEIVIHPSSVAGELRKRIRESARARNKKKREDMNKPKLDQPDLDFAHMCLKHDNFGHVLSHIIQYSAV